MPEDTEGKQLAQRLCSETAELGIDTPTLIAALESKQQRLIACLWEALDDDRATQRAKCDLELLGEGLEHLRSLVSPAAWAEDAPDYESEDPFPDEPYEPIRNTYDPIRYE